MVVVEVVVVVVVVVEVSVVEVVVEVKGIYSTGTFGSGLFEVRKTSESGLIETALSLSILMIFSPAFSSMITIVSLSPSGITNGVWNISSFTITELNDSAPVLFFTFRRSL